MARLLEEKMRPIYQFGAARTASLRASTVRQQSSNSRSASSTSTRSSTTLSTGKPLASAASSHSATPSEGHSNKPASSKYPAHSPKDERRANPPPARARPIPAPKKPPSLYVPILCLEIVSDQTTNRRETLQKRWTRIAKAEGAAPISIVDDIDDDEMPSLVAFQYVESEYIRYATVIYSFKHLVIHL
jgi:hypothetical protein